MPEFKARRDANAVSRDRRVTPQLPSSRGKRPLRRSRSGGGPVPSFACRRFRGADAFCGGGAWLQARPVNRRVLESSGDMGVPRVQRPPPTEVEPFNLSAGPTPSRSARGLREKHLER